MGLSIGKELRPAYGFDEVAIVPGSVTVNPELTDIHLSIREFNFDLPIVAAALDAVVDPGFAGAVGRRGGLAVMNLEGIQTRYDDPDSAIAEIVSAPTADAAVSIQRIYASPIKDELVGRRVQAIKAAGAICAVSCTPANTKRLAPIAVDAGADILVVQSTVTTARHISRSVRGLIFEELCENIRVPVLVGNTVTYGATKE
ncbi:MAG: IMP dehydrogenase, partial [Dehalococcoidia bacterium]